jgi:hypothetical protein
LKITLGADPGQLLPDVQIFYNAVRYALEDDLFYQASDFAAARKMLREGKERAQLLKTGQAPWTAASGLVLRGFRSSSMVPFSSWTRRSAILSTRAGGPIGWIFAHGRNKLSELSLWLRGTQPGRIHARGRVRFAPVWPLLQCL